MLLITVKHKLVDGAHFFTAADEDADGMPFPLGLCMAHSDRAVALAETERCVGKLLELNHDITEPFELAVIEDA